MSAIACMKVTAGIDLCHELAPKHREMIKKLSLPQSISQNQSPTDTIMVVFEKWLAGNSSLPLTWGEMMEVFREIKMNHLAIRIERYFGTTSENGLSILYECDIVLHTIVADLEPNVSCIPKTRIMTHLTEPSLLSVRSMARYVCTIDIIYLSYICIYTE